MSTLTPSDERALTAAQHAAQSGIRELLSSQEAKVLNRMLEKYVSKSGLSPEEAKVGVAVIYELRNLAGNVNRAVEAGRAAGRRLTS